MKKISLIMVFFTWLSFGTLMLSRWWYANPNYFPQIPVALWKWLDRLLNAHTVDDASNVEFFVVTFLALLAVIAFSLFIFIAYQYFVKTCSRHFSP